MRKHLQELKNKIYKKTVFIVGGGPTVNNINIKDLDSQLTIALNNSYDILPNATALYWSDASWADKHHIQLNNHKCKLRFNAKHHAITHTVKDLKGPSGATILHRTAEFGFNSDPDSVCGNNSGAHALNLAVNMGASRIVLLGYDMKVIGRETHYHGGHGHGLRRDIYPNLFIPSITSMSREIKELNLKVEIVNASPDSDLMCFPFVSYKDYLV